MTLNEFVEALARTSNRDWMFDQYGAIECNDVYGHHTVQGAVPGAWRLSLRRPYPEGQWQPWVDEMRAAASNLQGHDTEIRRRLVTAVGLASAWHPPSAAWPYRVRFPLLFGQLIGIEKLEKEGR